ncbi:BTA121 domain-containing protein surface lipoprotein [Borrelia anserina]|uniref:Cytosolic protein n=1 Tax=Borrelia anserina BA2 TaxID=1313293 RepID=W5SPC4_BORAN|nr:hypothetical protein [Borrelia anserina]AHH09024.1 Hypothetical protein BAN_0900026 [Borrelia anserina BA2]
MLRVNSYISLFLLLLSLGCNNEGTKKSSTDSTFDLSKTSFVGKRSNKGINLPKKGLVEVDVGKSDLKKGTGENSVVKVDVGSEKVDAGSEKVDAGSEKVDAGSEKVDAGSEKVDAGSEKVDAGSEKVDAGSEKVDAGSEKVDAGSEKVNDELEDDIDLKIQNLLDEFKLSAQQKESIMDLKDVLTNPDVGSDEGYKTYSREEFYDLFNHTGNVNADSTFKLNFFNLVTKYVIPVFQEQKEARGVIRDIEYQGKNLGLEEKFTLKIQEYQLGLKKIFSYDANSDFLSSSFLFNLHGHCDLATDWFREIQKEAVQIVEVMQLCERRQTVIDYIKSELTYPYIIDGSYNSYNEEQFYCLLVKFSATKLEDICNVLQVIVETGVAIANIKTEGMRETLGSRFNGYKNLYAKRLRETFSLDNVDDIYTDILRFHSNYLVDIIKIKEKAIFIAEGEKRHAELSDGDRIMINHIKNEVSNNFVMDFIDLHCKFYFMLGKMDLDSIKKIAENVRYIFDLQDKVKQHIETVSDEGFRVKLESKLKYCKNEYLKDIGSCLYDGIVKLTDVVFMCTQFNNLRNSYEGQLFSIKSQALGFISFQGFVKELSEDDLEVIDYMRSLVTNSIFGGSANYTVDEFNCVMGMMGSSSVLRDTLRPHAMVFRIQKEAKSIIDNIKEVASQERLRRRFAEAIAKYKALLGNIFVKRNIYHIYYSNLYEHDLLNLAKVDLGNIRYDAIRSL